MNTHSEFINIYLIFCASLRDLYGEVQFLDFGSIHDELYFKFALTENIDKDVVLRRALENSHDVSQNIVVENSECDLIDYVKFSKANNEMFYSVLFENFLHYGTHFATEIAHKEILRNLYENRQYKYEDFYYWEIERLIKSVHYSAWNINKCFCTSDPQIEENYFNLLDINFTYLFINLHALLTNLESNNFLKDSLKLLLDHFQIKEYSRFKKGKSIKINSIDNLISHFRDAVCHLEERTSEITKLPQGGNWRLLIHGHNIQYGEGFINWHTQLLRLIAELTNLIIGKKECVVLTNKHNNQYLFSLLVSEGWTLFYPILKQQYRIENKDNEKKYTIFLKKD